MHNKYHIVACVSKVQIKARQSMLCLCCHSTVVDDESHCVFLCEHPTVVKARDLFLAAVVPPVSFVRYA